MRDYEINYEKDAELSVLLRFMAYPSEKWLVENAHRDSIKTKEPIECVCQVCGHTAPTTINNMYNGHGCKVCANASNIPWEKVEQDFLALSMVVTPGQKYKNNWQKLEYTCLVCGAVDRMTYGSVQQGHACWHCNNPADKRRLSLEEVKAILLASGRILDPEVEQVYQNRDQHLAVICLKRGHKHFVTVGNAQAGDECGECYEIDNFYKKQHYDEGSDFYNLGGRVARRTGKSKKVETARLVSLLSDDEREDIIAVYSSNPKGYVVDHIVPLNFFNVEFDRELRASSLATNLRAIPNRSNNSRRDALTIAEIVDFFHSKELREIYNSATQWEEKEKYGLPIRLELDDRKFQAWCAVKVVEGIEKKDSNRFERWLKMGKMNKQSLRVAMKHVYMVED